MPSVCLRAPACVIFLYLSVIVSFTFSVRYRRTMLLFLLYRPKTHTQSPQPPEIRMAELCTWMHVCVYAIEGERETPSGD